MRDSVALNLVSEEADPSELIQQVKPKKTPKLKKTKASPTDKLKAQIELVYENTRTLKKEGLALIQTEQELDAYLESIYRNGEVAIDTETGGFNCYTDGLAGICLYTPGKPAVYLPIDQAVGTGKPWLAIVGS